MGCANSQSKYHIQQPYDLSKESNLITVHYLNRTLITPQPGSYNDHHLRPYPGKDHKEVHHDQNTTNDHKEDSQLLKEINFERIVQYFRQIYDKSLFVELKDVKKYDVKSLQIVIRALYSELISQKLMSVNRMEINMKQCKIQIAQSMLSILIEALKFTIEHYSINHGNALFSKLQKFSKTLSNFLKTKYPRGQNIDAGKLSKQFKQFDCTQQFQHDIIANSRVLFKSKNKQFLQIIKRKKQHTNNNNKQITKKHLFSFFTKADSNPQNESNNQQDHSQHSQTPKSDYSQGTQYINLNNPTEQDDGSIQKNHQYKDYQGEYADSQQSEQKNEQQQENQVQNDDHDTEFEITNNIKIFLNRIMDQIDRNYQSFCQLFKDIDPNFKVSRKISQNTARCTKLDTGVVEITSIEVARVMVKWLQNLEEIIKKPQELITSNYDIKIAKYNKFNQYSTVRQMNMKQDRARNKKSQIKYTKCLQKQFQKLLNEGNIIQKLKKGYQKYQKQITYQKSQKYQHYFKQFTTFILKNLQHSILDQRQISISEMEIVKYSYEISNLISWIVQEKLIAIIKILTSMSQQFKFEKGVPNFIKFKVNDLMRCHLSGDQKTIKEAYDKILQKQTKNQIEIVKIKNRFHTENHDAMILFKMKGSFLICQCQLALSDEQYKNDQRIKHIYDLNHFLYELERSPFGIFGQLSVFLKTQSHTVSSYYSKLRLKPTIDRLEEIKKCYKREEARKTKNNVKIQEQIEYQNKNKNNFKLKPFVCSICLKYFHKFSNYQHKLLTCPTCVTNVCWKCQNNKLKQKNKNTNDVDKHKKSTQKLFDQIFMHIFSKVSKKNEQLQLGEQQSIEKVRLQQIFQPLPQQSIRNNSEKPNHKAKLPTIEDGNKEEQNGNSLQKQVEKEKEVEKQQRKQTRIKAEQMMKYFDKTQSSAIKNSWKIHFVIFSKIGNRQSLLLYRYNSFQSVIENVYSPIEKYLKHQYIELSESSKIFLLKNIFKTNVSKKQYLDDFIQQERENKQNLQRIDQNQNQNQQENSSKSKNHKKKIAQKQRETTNQTSNTSLLDYWFSKVVDKFRKQPLQQDKLSVSSDKGYERNIAARFIENDAEENPKERTERFMSILKNCIQPFDYQQQLKFASFIKPSKHEFYFIQYKRSKTDESQSIFFLIDAQISKGNGEKNCFVKQLSRLPKIKNLKKQIDLSNMGADSQELQTMKSIIYKTIPEIEQMNLTGSSKITEMKGNIKEMTQRPFEWIANIKILDLSKNTLNGISILSAICPKIQRLDISENIVEDLTFKEEFKLLRQINAQDNLIKQVTSFKSFRNLQILDLSQNRINTFVPDGYCTKLKEIDISHNFIETTQNYEELKSLQILNLQDNSIEIIDCLKYPKKLRILNVEYNALSEVENIDALQNLQSLNLQKNWLKKFKINQYLPHLKCIKLSSNPLRMLKLNSSLHLQELHLNQTNLTNEKLFSIVLDENSFNNLEILSLKSNSLTKIPDFSKFMQDKGSITLKQICLDNNPILYGVDKKFAVLSLQAMEKQDDDQGIESSNEDKYEIKIKNEKQITKTADQIFQDDKKHIDELIQSDILFSLPVQENLLKNEQSQYFEHLIKLANNFKKKRIRFSFFQNQTNQKNDRYRQNFYRQKPQTKTSKFHSLSSHDSSRKDKQIEFSQSSNYIYMKHVFQDESDIQYHYRKDEEKSGFYHFWHPSFDISFKHLFMFDWEQLSFIDLRSCQINDEKWQYFVSHAQRELPNIAEIKISSNNINTVKLSQLQVLKSLKCIYFFENTSYETELNPLTEQSISEIKKFNTKHNPRQWAISSQEEQQQYENFVNNQNYSRNNHNQQDY